MNSEGLKDLEKSSFKNKLYKKMIKKNTIK